MGINLGSISQDDKDRINSAKNPSSFDAGDDLGGSGGSGADFGDLFESDGFGSLDDIFGPSEGGNSDPFGGSSSGGDPFGGGNNLNNGNSFGGNGFGGNNFGGGLTGYSNNGNMNQQQPPKQDTFDKVFDASVEGVSNIGAVLIELIKSLKNRTADDLGYYSSNLIKTGMLGLAIGVILCIVSALTQVGFLGIRSLGGQLILAFTLTAGNGMICLGIAAMAIAGVKRDSEPDIRELPDAGEAFDDNATDDYEEALGDIMADLFGDDEDTFDDGFGTDIGFGTETASEPEEDFPDFGDLEDIPKIDFNAKVDEVPENRLINRKVLVDTLIGFLPLNSKKFAQKKTLDSENEYFKHFEAACLKAMSNILKCDYLDVQSSLEECIETFYSYELRIKRVRGIKNMDELAREIGNYVKDNPNDASVNITADIIGDSYRVIITKGNTSVVTLGDCFQQKEVKEFFSNEKNKLPMITGITELGKVILDDAKVFDTMLIAGKPRSGKSWYVLNILISLMMFNTPEEIQFIIVDPKESNLFKTLSLMPHVTGLHNDDYVLKIMDDLIENEAPRRKKLIADHGVEDIWGLRKKGVTIPVLYLVMDEYITILENLKKTKMEGELASKMRHIISQFPALGIRILFVPHRSTNIVDKTNRTMLQFKAAVKSDPDEVADTLDIKSWSRPLVNQGDIAVKTSTNYEALFVRGPALTTSDEENTELIKSIAKVFYKMGVDMPAMDHLEVAANRDEEHIRNILGNDNRIQYNDKNIFDNI